MLEKLSFLWEKLQCLRRSISLSDQFLLLFLLLLMLKSGHTLLFEELALQEISTVNVVVRTSSAGIFGYLVSSNFHHPAPVLPSPFQIVVVSVIGLFSLLLLLFAPLSVITSGSSLATISQLRDFVSGSIGFLMGHSTQSRKAQG